MNLFLRRHPRFACTYALRPLFLLAIALLAMDTGVCNDQQYFNEGKEYGEKEKSQPSASKLADIPGSDGKSSPEQKYYNDHAALTNDSTALFVGGSEQSTDVAKQVSGTVQETANKRPMYLFDENNEFIQEGNDIVKNALSKLGATEHKRSVSTTVEKSTHTCEEAREPALHTCRQTRHVQVNAPLPTVHRVTASLYSHGWGGGLSKNVVTGQQYDGSTPNNGGAYTASVSLSSILPSQYWNLVEKVQLISSGGPVSFSGSVVSMGTNGHKKASPSSGYVIVDITYRALPTVADIKESIEDSCAPLEQRSDQGICEYVDEIILKGPETRIINGLAVYRDWWEKQRTYRCSYPSKNNCGELRRRGCSQISSQCKTWIEGTCVEYTQTYECEGRRETVQGSSLSGPVPFCLDGNCDDHSWAPNQDFAEAISKLAILREMQNDMSKNPIVIFKGEKRSCRKDCVGFRDCCGTGKGWGKSIGYSCDPLEKQLAELREKRKCVMVGTFCAEKELGVCIRKRTTFCCFGSKLVRLVQEQGRSQLGFGWGSPEQPECRGLTVDEISRIDFSKLDLTEVFEEIMAKTNKPDFQKFSHELKHNAGAKLKDVGKIAEKKPGESKQPGGKDEIVM